MISQECPDCGVWAAGDIRWCRNCAADLPEPPPLPTVSAIVDAAKRLNDCDLQRLRGLLADLANSR